MMFNFSSFNHCYHGRVIIEDITRTMACQLVALGHDMIMTEEPDFIGGAGGYNVILESFADNPDTIRRIGEAHSRGCRFIIVATEEPSSAGFNAGIDPAMVDRQNAFPEAARYADGILHLIPGADVNRWYSQFAPSAYAEIGYAPGFVDDVDDIVPDRDFGFYGKMTWRREQMLAELERTGSVLRITSLDIPRRERDRIMRSARVIVQIRANEEWGAISSTRCATALSFGRPVMAEPHPIPGPWAGIVHFSDSVGAFYADARSALPRWRDEHAQQFARFKDQLSPERCIGEPLRNIGILP